MVTNHLGRKLKTAQKVWVVTNDVPRKEVIASFFLTEGNEQMVRFKSGRECPASIVYTRETYARFVSVHWAINQSVWKRERAV